ncbi:hypothetical protein [Myxococcus sp. Y35]|uniref:hypothetical protein n=1 Tax=Pseudomyxococcus flavus TaxID=3115648 RepID=UPI003CEF32CD
MTLCRKHPDVDKALQLERQKNAELSAKVRRLAESLDRYGRHLRGCRLSRTWGRLACSCGLHDRIREGGINP